MESLPRPASSALHNGSAKAASTPNPNPMNRAAAPSTRPRNPAVDTANLNSKTPQKANSHQNPNQHVNPPPSRDSDITSPASSTSVSSPPYWVQSHHRSVSNVSVASVGITLQDNTVPSADGSLAGYDKNGACWAKGVHIDDHVVVKGGRAGFGGIGAFVVWNVRIETLRGATINLKKRYSEFDDLRDRLLMTFPLSEAAMPPLPPKGVISKFRPQFLEQRRLGLSYFLNCILLNPEFSGSPVLKDFIFA